MLQQRCLCQGHTNVPPAAESEDFLLCIVTGRKQVIKLTKYHPVYVTETVSAQGI